MIEPNWSDWQNDWRVNVGRYVTMTTSRKYIIDNSLEGPAILYVDMEMYMWYIWPHICDIHIDMYGYSIHYMKQIYYIMIYRLGIRP